MQLASHTSISAKKNRRKRGLNELDLNSDDCPALKRHRLNSKQPNTFSRENKENDSKLTLNNINNFNVNKSSLIDKKGKDKKNCKTTSNVTTLTDNVQDSKDHKDSQDSKHNREDCDRLSSSVDTVDTMEMDNTCDKIENMMDEETDENEMEDIDIEMNTNGNGIKNDRTFQEPLNRMKMDCDFDENYTTLGNRSVLGSKAKNLFDYSPKFQRSGLLFLVQCGIGIKIS